MQIQCLLKAIGLPLYSMSLMAVYLEYVKLLDTSDRVVVHSLCMPDI